MAQNFIACDREQELLLPPSLREWLPEEHLAWFVLDAVGELDLAAFFASYRDDGWGRAAHDPAMMVALFVYAYAIGVRSSRAIERRCHDDVAFRVITANQAPDHATIARFRVRHEAAIAELFGEVLALCARSGLVKVGVVAVDGTKIAAAATHHATRSYEQIAREILEDAARIDAAEDELYRRGARRRAARGAAHERGSPQGAARGQAGAGRRARRAGQEGPARPRRAAGRVPAPVAAGLGARAPRRHRARRLARGRDRQRRVAADGRRAPQHQALSAARAEPAGKINVTDPDSRNLKTTRGWVQGYNAQAVVGEGQIVLAAEISTESLDTANLQPMIETAIGELEAAGVTETPGVVLADAGYWKNDAIEALCGEGIPTLVAPDADRRKEPRPGRRGGRYDFARRVLATDWGKQLYLKRQGSVEPVFGQIKSNRGADRFQRRGRSAVRSEWRLLTATHNLLKLHRHQLATA